MRRTVAVTRFIGQGRGDAVIPGGQSIDVGRRHSHAPVARGIQRGGVRFIIDGDGDHITRCRAGDRPGDNQRLRVLNAVDDVVIRNGVNGQLRHRGIHQHVTIHRGRVTRFVGYRRGDGVVSVGNAAQVG